MGLEKRSLRSLRYRNRTSEIPGKTLSSVTQRKQHNAIYVTQPIPLPSIILSICEAKHTVGINEPAAASRVNASIGILFIRVGEGEEGYAILRHFRTAHTGNKDCVGPSSRLATEWRSATYRYEKKRSCLIG